MVMRSTGGKPKPPNGRMQLPNRRPGPPAMSNLPNRKPGPPAMKPLPNRITKRGTKPAPIGRKGKPVSRGR